MNHHHYKIVVLISFLAFLIGCQQSSPVALESSSTKNTLTLPCKGYTSPPIKDKEKLKDMLLKEGKLNKNMSADEVNQYINDYIKRKNTPACKKTIKHTAFVDQENQHA